MAGKATDRKSKSGKELKSGALEKAESVAAFTLPESLPCSEINFPILLKKKCTANWNDIVEESDKNRKEIEEFTLSKKEAITKPPFQKTECDYIIKEVFVYLIPALEETLHKAATWNALKTQKCFFNGLDHIAQLLWNNNPRYPYRHLNNLHLFNMPWVRDYLKNNPRPYYPKSWLWPEEYAATLIQKTVRQYFVQREEDVQEMRDFWKSCPILIILFLLERAHFQDGPIVIMLGSDDDILGKFKEIFKFNRHTCSDFGFCKLEVEQTVPEMETNPYLAKKFASQHAFNKK